MLELLAESLLIALRRETLLARRMSQPEWAGPSDRRNRAAQDIPEWERR